jgi:hypothetical protein
MPISRVHERYSKNEIIMWEIPKRQPKEYMWHAYTHKRGKIPRKQKNKATCCRSPSMQRFHTFIHVLRKEDFRQNPNKFELTIFCLQLSKHMFTSLSTPTHEKGLYTQQEQVRTYRCSPSKQLFTTTDDDALLCVCVRVCMYVCSSATEVCVLSK